MNIKIHRALENTDSPDEQKLNKKLKYNQQLNINNDVGAKWWDKTIASLILPMILIKVLEQGKTYCHSGHDITELVFDNGNQHMITVKLYDHVYQAINHLRIEI